MKITLIGVSNHSPIERSELMDMFFNMRKRPIARCSAVAATAIALLCASYCPAQQNVLGQFLLNIPEENNPVTIVLGASGGQSSNAWSPGQSENLIISILNNGTFQTTANQNPGNVTSLSIWQWPQYQTTYVTGPADTNVTLSNFHYIDATHAGFTATIVSGAPTGVVDQLDMTGSGMQARWPIFFQTASPPSVPGTPGPNRNCPTPNITSVIPSTWIAGQTYPVKIMGSGFSSDAQAATNPNCPANQLTVTVPAGSVTVSDVHVINSTEIDATVAPANTDPDEQATLNLYFRHPNESVVRNPSKSPTTFATAKPQDNGGPPGWDSAQANAQISSLVVQVQNVTPTLSLKPEQASISPSAALIAHLTLGGSFQISLGPKQSDGTVQNLASTFALGVPTLQGKLDSNALFPGNTVFQYTDQTNNAAVFQAVHLGTQQLTITPNDIKIPPINITLSVEVPNALGAQINKPALLKQFPNGLDSVLYPLADATGIPPQMIKGQVAQEGKFNPMSWRYEPFNGTTGDFAYSSKRDLRQNTHYGSSLRLPTIGDSVDPGNCGANYNYATHVDSRIPDPNCRGLAPGVTFSSQVMSDLLQQSPHLLIPERDQNTGVPITDNNGNPVLRPLSASDRYVSARDIFEINDYNPPNSLNWSGHASSTAVTKLKSGSVAFTAQLSLAASYGLLQVTYVTAIDLKWTGNWASCGASDPKDPDNLFDTKCNLDHGGGTLGIGTRYTEGSFANQSGVSPSLINETNLEADFSSAYQQYNTSLGGYGDMVISKTRSYEPNPAGAIFTSGGQQ